jgi:hypothetical protein
MEWILAVSLSVNAITIWLCVNSFRKWDRDQQLMGRLDDQVRRRDIVIAEIVVMIKDMKEDEDYDRSLQQLKDHAAQQCCAVTPEIAKQAN